MTEERKPAADRGVAEALGLVIFARDQALLYQDRTAAEAIGWARVAQIWSERAIESYHQAHSVLALQDSRVRVQDLRECTQHLRHARNAAATGALPLRDRSRLATVREALLDACDKLEAAAAEVERMAEQMEVR